MASPHRRILATLLVFASVLVLGGWGRSAGRKASDKLAAEIRSGTVTEATAELRSFPRDSGWDNDSIIDAYVDVVAFGDRAARVTAIIGLSNRRALQAWGPPKDSRALDFMLPARIAPILLASLREDVGEGPQYRGGLLVALGSIDNPSPEVIAAVVRALEGDAGRVPRQAVVAAGMLGFHAAEVSGDLARMLDDEGLRGPGRGRWAASRLEVAGALARVSPGVHHRALEVIVEAAHDEGSPELALTHLRDLGSRARPASDDLLSILILSDDNTHPSPFIDAIVAVSPERLPALLAALIGRAASEDASTSMLADGELARLAAGMDGISLPSRVSIGGPTGRMDRVVRPLANLSAETHARALDTLIGIARGEKHASPRVAVDYLRRLGSQHAGSVAGDLMVIFHEKSVERPPVAEAILGIAPDLFPGVVAELADLAASDDRGDVLFADHELSNLSDGDGREWPRSEEMAIVTPKLAAALDARPASEGAALAGVLRRINTRSSRAAYNAYVSRERLEQRKGRDR